MERWYEATVAHGGEELSLLEWGRLNGLSPATIHRRLTEGWDPGEAVTTPALKRKKRRSVIRRV